MKQVSPERAYVLVDFYCGDDVQNLPNRDGITRKQPKDSGEHLLPLSLKERRKNKQVHKATLMLNAIFEMAVGLEELITLITTTMMTSCIADRLTL
ncbi:hypothetical protein PsorP6_012421 [Peronosclerospora sorghi]|uniref:Uncharacterized protein n=1 Tax=Peronosclerospora sorghi TaxID=230839 RepID=A0ACC0WH97_9STRA|nr:hypothetical protein PsorP6_012421 [Peronosclerospora sorghi]